MRDDRLLLDELCRSDLDLHTTTLLLRITTYLLV